MTIEIVFDERFETVRDAVTAALGESGFRVAEPALAPGVQIKAKMAILRGERGNGLLAMVLPFLFKTEALAAIVAAYDDGTTGVTVREAGAYGGNLASGAVSAIGGSSITGMVASSAGSLAAQGVDHAAKQQALGKQLARVDGLLREKLAGKIAYEGPVKPGVQQVPA